MQNIEQTNEQGTDSTRMASALLGLMKSLTDAMETEMTFLEKQDISGIENVRELKARLVRDYNNNVKLLAQRPGLLHEAPPEMRASLRASNERLEQVSQRNAEAIKAAIGATQSLIETIVDAARRETKRTDCYSDPRKLANVLGSYSPLCPPVAVNRTA
jgi:flagellar biosynthesis/type III secretory pathway chaperone